MCAFRFAGGGLLTEWLVHKAQGFAGYQIKTNIFKNIINKSFIFTKNKKIELKNRTNLVHLFTK